MEEKRIYTLFIKYKYGRLSASDREELRAWLETSEANRELFVSFLRICKQEAQFEALEKLDSAKAWDTYKRRRLFRRYLRSPWTRWAVAAVLVGCVCLWSVRWDAAPETSGTSLAELFPNHGHREALFVSGQGQVWSQTDSTFVWLDPKAPASQTSDYRWLKYVSLSRDKRSNEVHVPRGGEYSLVLADGTKVWLNACSTLRFSYPFDSLRVVNLEGEAYFEVTHNQKPFEVHAAGSVVRVLGTKFDVRAYAGQPLQVTLAEGRVQVDGAGGDRRLLPGEQLTEAVGTYDVHEVDARRATAWTRGVFEFDDTPLDEIVRQLERWYDVDMDYASADLKHIRFTGTILRKESLGYALEMIQKVSDVCFSKKNGRVLIEKRK